MNIKLLQELSDNILRLAPEISKTIEDRFKKYEYLNNLFLEQGIDNKQQDLTTTIDHTVGKLLIERVYKKYPDLITIDSEESTERIGVGPIILRCDPLDGTKHFVKGIPLLASTLALVENGQTIFALVIDVFGGNIFHAIKGKGAYMNDRKIHVGHSNIFDPFSFLMYEAPNSKIFADDRKTFFLFTKYLNILHKISYRTRSIGLGSLSICYVASSASPAYVDLSNSTKLYDIEAALLIAQEAGAIIGNIKGKLLNTLIYNPMSDKKILENNLIVANPIAFKQINEVFSNSS